MRNPFKRAERVVTKTVYRRVPVPVLARDFEAASNDRLQSSWSTTPSSINQFLGASLVALKARSRDQGANNPYALKYVELSKTNIVGPRGVRLQAQARIEGGLPDKPANGAIEDGWREWGEDPSNCDAAGILTWIDLQELAVQTLIEDGEFLARLITGAAGGPFGLRIQVIETDRIDVGHRDDLQNGNRIRQGIEYNPWGRPVAYWILKEAPEYAVGFMTMSADRERVSADQIIHLFRTRQAGQHRGIPWLHASLWHLKQLHGWLQAGVVAARVGASKVGFIETTGADGFQGDTEADDEGAPQLDMGDPGTLTELDPGQTFSSWDPDYPKGETREFAKVLLMGISVGGNVAYHALSGDLEGVNYSSIRAGVLEDRETWKGLQRWFIEHFVSPVYRRWVASAVLNQALVADSVPLMDGDIRRFYRVHWQGRRWPWVDPQKDWAANKIMLETNSGTVPQIIREQGNDPDEVLQEIVEWNEKLKTVGLKPYTAAVPSVPAAAPPKDDDIEAEKPDDKDDAEETDDESRVLALVTRKPVCNERAYTYATGRIINGYFNDGPEWSFVESDRLALAEKPGRYYLTRDTETDQWDHPTGRFDDAGEFIVYLAALELAVKHSIEEDVISAALELAGMIDAAEDVAEADGGDGNGVDPSDIGGDGEVLPPPKPPEIEPDFAEAQAGGSAK